MSISEVGHGAVAGLPAPARCRTQATFGTAGTTGQAIEIGLPELGGGLAADCPGGAEQCPRLPVPAAGALGRLRGRHRPSVVEIFQVEAESFGESRRRDEPVRFHQQTACPPGGIIQ